MPSQIPENASLAKLPAYLNAVNIKDFQNERLRFIIRLAALYASPEGTLAELAIRLGKAGTYFQGAERGVFRSKISGDMAYAIEQLCDGRVTRADIRPDLFA